MEKDVAKLMKDKTPAVKEKGKAKAIREEKQAGWRQQTTFQKAQLLKCKKNIVKMAAK